MGMKEKSN